MAYSLTVTTFNGSSYTETFDTVEERDSFARMVEALSDAQETEVYVTLREGEK